jgi:CDGSH-type Zn-finger protein
VTDSWQALSLRDQEVRLTPCPGGPTLVRRADVVVDEQGTVHPVERPVVAVCTCGKSQRKPWCDSTHKAVRRGRDAPRSG